MPITEETKQWIDTASLRDLLWTWRFARLGEPMLQGETGEYFRKVMTAKRAADKWEWARVSREVGHGNKGEGL